MIPVLLYCCETWVIIQRDRSRIQACEEIHGKCDRHWKELNEELRNWKSLKVCPINNCTLNFHVWKIHMNGMDNC